MAALVVLNLWHLLGGPRWLFWGIAFAAGAFVWAERDAVPRGIRRVALVLTAIAIVVWPLGGAGLHSLERGLYIGAMISSVMACVSLLARAARHSPALGTLSDHLLQQGYRRRYVLLAVAGQVLPCMLGFAGVHLLLGVAQRGAHANEAQRLAMFTVVSRSFSSATLWSPTFGNMVILLALYPQLRWGQVLPVGLALAASIIVLSMVVDRRLLRAAGPDAPPPPAPPGVLRASAVFLLAMVVFFIAVMCLAGWLHLPVSAGISMLAPLVALGLHYRFAGAGRTPKLAARRVLADARDLRIFAPEVLLFMAAGCGGTVIADTIPREWIGAVAGMMAGYALPAILALIASIMTLSLVGVHPVLSAVLLASTFSPAALNLPPLIHVCTLLTGWCLATIVAPFSMTNMTASRYAGIGLVEYGIRQNGRFAAVSALVLVCVLAAMAAVVR
ncbi:hypothetical protein [Verticiella alkaliphila]|uniref:hypothetical protein n=1 Tax=Verticiella alkaliphila TaxID=2779529 RepID=UPI001C0AA1EA|nr:hypothetical protein [Verticiella sp. GG226]